MLVNLTNIQLYENEGVLQLFEYEYTPCFQKIV